MRRNFSLLTLLLCLFTSMACVAQPTPPFSEVSTSTRLVAAAYFAAYIERDWPKLSPLLADRGTFADPTAELVFGSVASIGKKAVMKRFENGYADIKYMHFNSTREVYAGRHAIFEGTLDWTLRIRDGREAVTKGMPFLTILKVEEGQVVEHLDYADYQPFLEALRNAKSGG
jgi:ketosteroid isomerase-like protein